MDAEGTWGVVFVKLGPSVASQSERRSLLPIMSNTDDGREGYSSPVSSHPELPFPIELMPPPGVEVLPPPKTLQKAKQTQPKKTVGGCVPRVLTLPVYRY